MKLIIKPGNKKTKLTKRKERCYKTKCWNCGCKFIYQDEDAAAFGIENIWYEVECPYCKAIQTLPFKVRTFKYKITEVKDEYSREI